MCSVGIPVYSAAIGSISNFWNPGGSQSFYNVAINNMNIWAGNSLVNSTFNSSTQLSSMRLTQRNCDVVILSNSAAMYAWACVMAATFLAFFVYTIMWLTKTKWNYDVLMTNV